MYHVTPAYAVNSILEDGIEARISDKHTYGDQIQEAGVFLFADAYDAHTFGSDNWEEYVVLKVAMGDYQDDLIPDPEYGEGEAWFYPGSIHPADIRVSEGE